MPTPHNNAKKEDFANVVLMPGDPQRAEWIAKTFLHDVIVTNTVRGNFGYTGYTKNNKRVSVMASGMGHGSIGIYTHELFAEYDTDLIIRVGTCGSYQPEINLFDVVLGKEVETDSNWVENCHFDKPVSNKADKEALEVAMKVLEKNKSPYTAGKIFSTDVFYNFDKDGWKKQANSGVLAVEMESAALYANASYYGKKALTLLTVTDSFIKAGILTPEERRSGLTRMIESAIEVAEHFAK